MMGEIVDKAIRQVPKRVRYVLIIVTAIGFWGCLAGASAGLLAVYWDGWIIFSEEMPAVLASGALSLLAFPYWWLNQKLAASVEDET